MKREELKHGCLVAVHGLNLKVRFVGMDVRTPNAGVFEEDNGHLHTWFLDDVTAVEENQAAPTQEERISMLEKQLQDATTKYDEARQAMRQAYGKAREALETLITARDGPMSKAGAEIQQAIGLLANEVSPPLAFPHVNPQRYSDKEKPS